MSLLAVVHWSLILTKYLGMLFQNTHTCQSIHLNMFVVDPKSTKRHPLYSHLKKSVRDFGSWKSALEGTGRIWHQRRILFCDKLLIIYLCPHLSLILKKIHVLEWNTHLPLSRLSPFLGKRIYTGVSLTVKMIQYQIKLLLLLVHCTVSTVWKYFVSIIDSGHTCLGNLAQFLFTDVIQVFLHLGCCLAHLTEGELRVDEHFGHHGLRRNTQGGKILFNMKQKLHSEDTNINKSSITEEIPSEDMNTAISRSSQRSFSTCRKWMLSSVSRICRNSASLRCSSIISCSRRST